MKTLVWHVGLHKTGSTFLQKEVFPKLQSISNLTHHGPYATVKLLKKKLNSSDVKQINSDIKKRAIKNISLISCEGLVGAAYPFRPVKDRSEILKDMIKVSKGFKVRIMLVLRRQDKMMESIYRDYVRGGATDTFSTYMLRLSKRWTSEKGYKKWFSYSLYVDELVKTVGKKNVLVLTQEELKKEPKVFLKKVCAFLGGKVPEYKNIPRNQSYGKFQMSMARQLNTIFKTRYNPKGLIPGLVTPAILGRQVCFKMFSKPYKIPKKWRSKILQTFEKDNKRLEKKYRVKF